MDKNRTNRMHPFFSMRLALLFILTGWPVGGAICRAEESQAEESTCPGEWEARLLDNPDDLATRLGLIAHYHAQFGDPLERAKRAPHVLWLIANHPAHPEAGHVRSRLHPRVDGPGHARGAALWKQQIGQHPHDPDILTHAARFISLDHREQAIAWLEKAVRMEPDQPARWLELARHKTLLAHDLAEDRPEQALATHRKAMEDLETALDLCRDGETRMEILKRLPGTALAAGQTEKAGRRAMELLRLAERIPGHPHSGAALHEAHTVMGKLAMGNGDLHEAARHLLLSVNIPGSSDLDTFGPALELAREVLAHGETEAVIGFLHLSGNFWKLGRPDLERWIGEIQQTGHTAFERGLAFGP